MAVVPLKSGDFTGLAENYAKFRPGYSETVLTALLALVGKPAREVDFVDVGAGTGIWTAMVASRGCRSAVAIEPNNDMRTWGQKMSNANDIRWLPGSGERTGLPAKCADLLTMASSFHWVDFDAAMREFARILRPEGRFAALWNPRLIEENPLLVEIEEQLCRLKPDLKRVSSGRSGITEGLTDRLSRCDGFDDVIYLEGRHRIVQSVEHYLGAWRSVNDIQTQLGPEKFSLFLNFIRERLANLSSVETTYLTRAWTVRRC